MSDELQAMSSYEKQDIVSSITNHAYERRPAGWHFRIGYAPQDFFFRIIICLVIWAIAFFSKAGTPKGREDRAWLESFGLVMIIFFTSMHAGAYFPSQNFGSFSEMWGASMGRLAHSYNTWRDIHYCACLLISVIVLYPFVFFGYLIYDGFNPYRDLTSAELKYHKTLGQSSLLAMLRYVFHWFLLFMAVYLIVLPLFLFILRHTRRYPGHHLWLVRKLSKLPYGSLFFQEGEFYDCGICMHGIWKESKVVALICDEKHVFHEECLRN